MKTHKLSVIRFLSFFYVIFFISCENDFEGDNSYAIMSLMIDKLATPIVPPPPPNLTDSEFKRKSDSIIKTTNNNQWSNEKFILSIEQIENFDMPKSISFSDIEFKRIVMTLEQENENNIIDISRFPKIRNIEYLKSKNHNSKNINWREIDMSISFSSIAFNKNRNKAAMIVGVSRGKLSGYSMLVFLAKVGNYWEIVDKHTLEIS